MKHFSYFSTTCAIYLNIHEIRHELEISCGFAAALEELISDFDEIGIHTIVHLDMLFGMYVRMHGVVYPCRPVPAQFGSST